MNFKKFSIIIALLSIELKVLSSPIKCHHSEKGKGLCVGSDSDVSSEESSDFEISDTEIELDEQNTVNVIDTSFENRDDDNDLETTDYPTDSVNNNEETAEVPTDSVNDNDLPCSDIQSCIGWMKENKEILIEYGYDLPDESFDYLLSQYQDKKNVEKLQHDFDAIDYGIKVDVKGHKMSVNIKGEEHNTTIVVLPGMGIDSPVIFYKSLTEILAKDYKVVTIEPFGYGVSDLAEDERTPKNVVSEIHECLQKLGIHQFYLMGHSLGGIHSIIYDNTFQNEVLGFIGLDNSPSNYDNYEYIRYNGDIVIFSKIFDKYHLWGLLPESQLKGFTSIDFEQQNQNYSEEELKDIMTIIGYRNSNQNNLDEYNLFRDSATSTEGLYFHCPLLMFLSSQIEENIPEWVELHENMINDNPDKELICKNNNPNEELSCKSKVIKFENTTHGFLHTEKKEEISDEIKKWIN